MSESKNEQMLRDQMLKKLEKTKFWKTVSQNVSRFEESEKNFFLDKIRKYYCEKEQTMVDCYTELVAAISSHYKPAAEAKRLRLVILIGQFNKKGNNFPAVY
ncbi:MAG: hypothetical protein WC842_00655 [Candidatus Paceibacterota bacterium]